jgi:GxxExxY protein
MRALSRPAPVSNGGAAPVRYKDVLLDCGYRIDLVVGGDLIVEVKCVETLLPIHQAQILTYMRVGSIKKDTERKNNFG